MKKKKKGVVDEKKKSEAKKMIGYLTNMVKQLAEKKEREEMEEMEEDSIERFVDVYDSNTYKTAYCELNRGKKTSHWIWAIFPQIVELGQSENAKYYGIKSIEEAYDFYNHEEIHYKFLDLVNVILNSNVKNIQTLMGSGIDAKKLQSCMTLFYNVTGNTKFKAVLSKYYDGKECVVTRNYVKKHKEEKK